MAPKALDVAIADRDVVTLDLAVMEDRIAEHQSGNQLMTEEVVAIHLQSLEDIRVLLADINKRIFLAAPTDLDDHKVLYRNLTSKTFELMSSLHNVKKTFPHAGSSSSVGGHSSSVKLPTLEIPPFDGNLMDWPQFRDMFNSIVDSNNKLSKAQKLAHLKAKVTGEAARLIKNLNLTDGNYDIAMTQLTNRYQNDRELLFAIYRRFLGQQSVVPNSAASVRTLVDITKECIRSLEVVNIFRNLELDSLLLFLIFSKLDGQSKELWEQTQDSKIPSLDTLFEFLEKRARSLSASGSTKVTSHHLKQDDKQRKVQVHFTQDNSSCKVCKKDNHQIFKCEAFLSQTVAVRRETIKNLHLCFNCLRAGHSSKKCSSTFKCRTCKAGHHTLLHIQEDRVEETADQGSSNPLTFTQQISESLYSQQPHLTSTMLATAIIHITSKGVSHACRAFLDGGSTNTLITESCVRRLGLNRMKHSAVITGLQSSAVATTTGITSLSISPHFSSSPVIPVSALIVSKVTGNLPLYQCNTTKWSHLRGLTLADPQFATPGPVDILLGSDLFWDLLQDGKKSGPAGTPQAINSKVGWLVAGRTQSKVTQVSSHVNITDLDESIQRFWELEAIPEKRLLTEEEERCEQHFLQHTHRDEDGRFNIVLPLRDPLLSLEGSKSLAIKRFAQLERRLPKTPHYYDDYRKFMKQYIELGHMELIPEDEISCPKNPSYYIPHHYVLKMDSTTTKFRVVFDATAKTSTGRSLNGNMMVGPVLQDNLVDIIMRFRLHRYAFSADLEKMYRQIIVSDSDKDLQRILWRPHTSESIREYRLKTVTYGTAAAPYLATRVLQQLAEDEKLQFPLGSKIMLRDFYVDDVLSGADTEDEAVNIQEELLKISSLGGFNLRQWSSNSSAVIKNLPADMVETSLSDNIDIMEDLFSSGSDSVKCLGCKWNVREDVFHFQAPITQETDGSVTKRILLSQIARLFDPLGWLGPVIIVGKKMIQNLWQLRCDWDEPLPASVVEEWSAFQNNLKDVQLIKLPRCIKPSKVSDSVIDLIGFCDASESAYAAVVYLCVTTPSQPPVISLITSKTRVAPLKKISLPRLELCGAHLLSQLISSVNSALHLDIRRITCWTDSTIVLSWIHEHPSRWKTFVANRVTEIQRLVNSSSWYHVPGVNNPADCASRGITPMELLNHDLWWNGPDFLRDPVFHLPASFSPIEDPLIDSERRPALLTASAVIQDDPITSILKDKSSYRSLIRVTALIIRFANKCRKIKCSTGPVSAAEATQALHVLVRSTQQHSFREDLARLHNKQQLSASSKLLPLNPFVDPQGVLRVGGRLRHAPIPHDQKHPILLPRYSPLTDLILRSTHLENLHAGPQLLLSILQQQFWIVRGRDSCRFAVKKCVTCTRQRAATLQQFMGDLPSVRVTPSRAFNQCGVDFAGPIILKSDIPRSKKTFKGYLSLFVCLSTRAIHIEVVTSLSSDAFVAALRRFVSRRSSPHDMYSDCGTNFIGADRELREVQQNLLASSTRDQITNEMTSRGITWHWNPPGAPHFGGLWEAGVKSVKHHLRRVVGSSLLTYEEMCTLTTQIEACLNSRPLTALSADPLDMQVLTPGHFLTGDSLRAVPQQDLTDQNTTRLDRWRMIQQMQQHFWQRWSKEFITRLQQRPKWLKQRTQPKVDDMVIIKDERLPPQRWRLGRIIQLHHGADNLARVATIKTSEGDIKRPITKICLLPVTQDKEDHL